jgi:hypothetical protein
VNLLGDNIDAMKKNAGTLMNASKEVGLEINTEKGKHMLLFRHRSARKNHDVKTANRQKICHSSDIWEQQ